MLLSLSFLQALGALTAALILNLTNLGPHSKPAPETLRVHPFPNPFPIPGTHITLHWEQAPFLGHSLDRADTEDVFLKCKDRADAHVRFIGDGPIGGVIPNYLLTHYGTVIVEFSNEIPGVILYSDVSGILMALSWKMSREGFRDCSVSVRRTNQGPLGEPLGRVSVRRTM